MRCRLILISLLLLAAGVARASEPVSVDSLEGVPPLLLDALKKVADDFDRWAFTETRVMTDDKGKTKRSLVLRFDPSKPYAEQYTPLLVDGKPPSEKDLKQYRKRGEKRGDRYEKQEANGRVPGRDLPQFELNGGKASIDLVHAVVTQEDSHSITYEVPLHNDERATIPVEKFQLMARVSKERHAFENVALKLRDGFRMKLILKVKSGEVGVDFADVDPQHNPVPVRIAGDASATVFFMKIGGALDLKRTDFKRVKPYSERFGVKIGPLKALEF